MVTRGMVLLLPLELPQLRLQGIADRLQSRHQGAAEDGERLFIGRERSFQPLRVEVPEPPFQVAEIGEHGAHLVEKRAVRLMRPVARVLQGHGVEEVSQPAECRVGLRVGEDCQGGFPEPPRSPRSRPGQ
jgi:hypothetical protein